MEQVDVVVVGARCAGGALAAPLARAGRKVVVLDRARFPSDTLSTHLMMPAGTAELFKQGALPGILRRDPSRVRYVEVRADGAVCRERMRPTPEGIDYGVCVPRNIQDIEIVEAARAAGADVRERCTVEAVTWRAGRATGVRYRDADGAEREIRATLVVGADGRKSTVAAHVGAWRPYRMSRNGRGLVFRYYDDPRAGTEDAETYIQYRDGEHMGFAFPTTPRGRLLILMMGHRDEASEARRDPEGYWARKLRDHPAIAERLEGAGPGTKLRSTGETPAFFRRSSGPGWALAGDAGHFKDPVTGQGMRDSMYMGRTLAEKILPVLDDPAAVDRATRAYEAQRDLECLHAYHFANFDTVVEPPIPALGELVRDAGRTPDPDLVDVFGRARSLQEIAPLPRLARAFAMSLVRGDQPRGVAVRTGLKYLRSDLEIRAERRRGAFRPTRAVTYSDHPGVVWPAPPRVEEPAAAHAADIATPTPQEAAA